MCFFFTFYTPNDYFDCRSYDDETDELIDQELRNMGIIQDGGRSNGDVINSKDFVGNSVRSHDFIGSGDGNKSSVTT